jgi:hypothetical protein
MMIGTEVYKNQRKAFYGKEISSRYHSAFGDGDRNKPYSDFPKWVENSGIVLEGRSFSFHRHEYLREPYNDPHPRQVEIKATQLGLTTKAGLRSIHGAITGRYPRGILYLFPSKTDVTEFSKGRINLLIDENPDSIGRWIKETDTSNLKQIGSSILYFRGMKSRVGLKSVPVDFIVFDELDEAPQKSVDMAMQRMAHSEVKEWLKLSNPTIPDFGIDKAFQQTDQRYWLLKCPSCGHYTCLEDTFPACLIELSDGRVIRGCEKCKSELDPSVGRWAAKNPQVEDVRGYHYSQLFSHFVDMKELLHDFRTTQNLTDFYNLRIGIAWVEATHRISLEAVYPLCGSYGMAETDPGPCSMGVDQGKDLHVAIGRSEPSRAGKIIHLGVYQEWEKLEALMKAFNVYRCVIDGMPETEKARSFAKKFSGKVFLNFYNEHQKGTYKWNEGDWTITCNRTESLDSSQAQILGAAGDFAGSSRIILPKFSETIEEFARHLHNVAKRLEEDEETGSKRYVYVKLGPDHFRHAFNYECIARDTFADALFPAFLR